jgi:hypothetical protein
MAIIASAGHSGDLVISLATGAFTPDPRKQCLAESIARATRVYGGCSAVQSGRMPSAGVFGGRGARLSEMFRNRSRAITIP